MLKNAYFSLGLKHQPCHIMPQPPFLTPSPSLLTPTSLLPLPCCSLSRKPQPSHRGATATGRGERSGCRFAGSGYEGTYRGSAFARSLLPRAWSPGWRQDAGFPPRVLFTAEFLTRRAVARVAHPAMGRSHTRAAAEVPGQGKTSSR